jgi:hypothetical protein
MKIQIGFVVALLLLVASPAFSQDDEPARRTLRGLKGVYVLVEDLESDAEKAGLSTNQIYTDVVLRLRKAGIKVLTWQEVSNEPGNPNLYIRASTMDTANGLYAYNIDVHLSQLVMLTRKSAIKFHATTWIVSRLGTVGFAVMPTIRDSICDLVDKFINAYLAMNPLNK